MRSLPWFVIAAVLVCTSCSRGPRPAPLRIAAAADLQFALAAISSRFEATQTGAPVQVSYGSSGNFYSQIRAGAPYDVFLSADVEYPRRLLDEGTGVAGSFFSYGAGRIVVWIPADSKLDPATALGSSALQRLAIANPAHAPYGRAAEAALKSMGLYDALRSKLVLGENISQAFAFARSGAAQAGIVALSLALAPEAGARGRFWEIPQNEYPPLEQGGIILKDSPPARAFRSFMMTSEAQAILRQYGFSVPEKH